MPVELRKRKAPAEPAPPPPAKKKSNPVKKAAEKAKAAVTGKTNGAATKASGSSGPVAVGATINLSNFGGEVETHDGIKTTLAKLVEQSKSGVVLFTYPKASTPGCTKQACMFRDDYKPLTASGFAIYGLSRDSPKANTTFVTKQSLPYQLLCDPNASLIGAIGMKKAPSGTTRGVFVVDKVGKVLAAEAGGPDATVDVARRVVGGPKTTETATPMEGVTPTGAAQPASKGKSEKLQVPAKPTASTIAKRPLTPTPAEKAAKKVTADPPAPSAPNGALAGTAEDAAVANVAADVADSATKVDSAPSATSPSVPDGALLDPSKDVAFAKVASDVAESASAAKLDRVTPNPA